MSKIEIKKAVLEATKRVEKFDLRVILWHGDGTYEGSNNLYNEVVICDERNRIVDTGCGIYGALEGTEESIKEFKKEQKSIYNYLKKHFNDVKILEENV